MKSINYIFLFCICIFFLSCGKKKETPKPPLKGTMWNLTGIVDAQTGVLTELDPDNSCAECYRLIFNSNMTAFGMYSVFLWSLNPTSMQCLGFVYDPDNWFCEALKSVISYEFNENELKFFFNNNQKYLLYQPIKPSAIFFPCGNTNEVEINSQSLKGTKWKLEGIVDTKTRRVKQLFEPNDCPECYTLIFDTDTTACGRSIINYSVKLISLNPVRIFCGLSMMECNDDDIMSFNLFCETLNLVRSYEHNENELIFYYNNNQNYLLYKQIKP